MVLCACVKRSILDLVILTPTWVIYTPSLPGRAGPDANNFPLTLKGKEVTHTRQTCGENCLVPCACVRRSPGDRIFQKDSHFWGFQSMPSAPWGDLGTLINFPVYLGGKPFQLGYGPAPLTSQVAWASANRSKNGHFEQTWTPPGTLMA